MNIPIPIVQNFSRISFNKQIERLLNFQFNFVKLFFNKFLYHVKAND